MNNTLSLKFKLQLNKEQKRQLLSTIKKYNEAVNFVLQDNFETKSVSKYYLHKKYYFYIRETYSLSSQMAINVYREVIRIYQVLKLQNKSSAIPRKTKPTICYTLNRNITIDPKNLLVSFSLSSGALKKICFKGWNKHYSLLKTSKLCDSKIRFDKGNKNFYLYVPVQFETSDISHESITGIDIGEKNIAVTYSTRGKEKIYKTPEQIKIIKKQYQIYRSSCRDKGTRSAKRKYLSLCGREKRFISDFTHKISKSIILSSVKNKLVMENLTGINNKRKTIGKGKNIKEIRRQREQWPFNILQFNIDYKSKLYNGIESHYVDPAYTSQSCPSCGFVSKENRINEIFFCLKCGYQNHADIVGAMNIAYKFLVNEQNENSMQFVNLLSAPGIFPVE